MMTGWVSLYGGWSSDGSQWDYLTQTYEGMTCFERTTVDVETVMPSALLICRFNYALCWKEQIQEGLGLYHSGHFEPCEELGFTIFDNVTKRLYDLNNWIGKVPAAPTVVGVKNNHLFLDTATYPLEYMLSATDSFTDGEWTYININDGITIPPMPQAVRSGSRPATPSVRARRSSLRYRIPPRRSAWRRPPLWTKALTTGPWRS